MKRLTNDECYNKLTKADCYIKTVNAQDKAKVKKARAGINPTTPASLIGQVAAELGLRAHADEVPPVIDPPEPPVRKVIAPRTFNSVPGGSNARYCVRGLTDLRDDFTRYDENGLDAAGGRDDAYQVPGLRQANNMDNYGPCDLYPPLTEWPGDMQDETGSYHR